jgi:alpha-galactosidase
LFEHNSKDNKLKIAKECNGVEIYGDYRAFDLIITEGSENEVFKQYFDSIKIEESNDIPLVSGWTSWYNYYTDITEEKVVENLDAFSENKIPIDIIQVDDGHQEYIGDWLVTSKKFPNGMKNLAQQIKSKGYKAGLWLAPFICEKKSTLYKEHPDWLLKDENGKPLVVGYNPMWSGDFYALDFYNNDAKNYIREVLEDVLFDWGYDMVKLDFLYAVQVKPRRGKTRGQIMYEAMDFIRRTAKNKIILGCGVPLAPCFGVVDYMRVGCDVNLSWGKNIIPSMTNNREVPSTIDSLYNTIYRRHLDGKVFGNDPDVFILRKDNNKLNPQQKYTLFMLNLIFGRLIFTSDNIKNYTVEEKTTYLSMFPMKEKEITSVEQIEDIYKIEFKIEDRKYIAFSNLGNKKHEMTLDEGFYFSNTTYEIVDNSYKIALSPYQSVCILKIDPEKEFELLGGKGHVFSGCDVKTFKVKWLGNVTLEMDEKNLNREMIYIKIPEDKKNYKINGKQYESEIINEFNIIKFEP